MAEVFISYSKNDRAKVDRLEAALRAFAVDLWLDTNMNPDDDWPSEIERQLSSSKVVVVCWSQSAVASDWVKREARGARSRSKSIIPVAIEPPRSFVLPLEFEDRHLADLSLWDGAPSAEPFLKLLSDVGDKLGKSALKRHYADLLAKKAEDAEALKRKAEAAQVVADTATREKRERGNSRAGSARTGRKVQSRVRGGQGGFCSRTAAAI